MARRRIMAIFAAATLVAGCLGTAPASLSPSPEPTPGATASATPTVLPTASPVAVVPQPTRNPMCVPADHPEWSVARRWDEALLNAIRRSQPNPPVHARNLFHLSVAMWDAWASYDRTAAGYFSHDKVVSTNPNFDREAAISYAAYRVLTARFETAVGGEDSLAEFAQLMTSLCYPVALVTTQGTSPAEVGNRVAAAVLARGFADGSNEAGGYSDPAYTPANEPLVVADTGVTMVDPNRWQPLQMAQAVSQNGLAATNLQKAIGTHWGHVEAFGAVNSSSSGVLVDPGPPPLLGDPQTDQQLKDQLAEVIRDSGRLDPAGAPMIDISPASRGANPLGTNDGTGHATNPVTGSPYAPNLTNRGDFRRAIAEFWADGPNSETPPGHWNVLANTVSDELDPDLRIGGQGSRVDRLEWDTKLYIALNGAVHNAAIAAWGLKGRYDSSRPISLIRYMGGLGQSSDPAGPSYDPEGLPLVPGLIEIITAESSAPGQRHERLADSEGQVVLLAWAGNPEDPTSQTSGSAWIFATQWVPYQQPTFVTPAFPGYVSGHSTFSRAAAEVMTGFTGSSFFPGGSSGFTVAAGTFRTELGPTKDVRLEWATYFDAADQAGNSRLYGGIHIQADDLTGRIIGSACGIAAWRLAQSYFVGAPLASALACQPTTGAAAN
jgi:hypothetical protein